MGKPLEWVSALEWVRFVFTIITPIGLFYLGARAAARKSLMESIQNKLAALDEKIDAKTSLLSGQVVGGKDECREDINSLLIQMQAFQREVARDNPTKGDVLEIRREFREELIQIRSQISSWNHDDRERRPRRS
jgi:hypothetical protein